jgi:tRNA(Phe) wybutosine-synthesizing methylase Tyw3
MSLMQSPTVNKIMESEKMGIVIEKAMSIPIKISSNIMSQKERLVALFDLATQQDLDEVRQSLARVEGVLRDIKKESGDLLRKVEKKDPEKMPIAE